MILHRGPEKHHIYARREQVNQNIFWGQNYSGATFIQIFIYANILPSLAWKMCGYALNTSWRI